MIKILKQQTATSYPVYYCGTSADLQKLSTFAPVGSIAYENGKQYILNSLREFAALEYNVNLEDIQLPEYVKEYWDTSSLGNILTLINENIFELYGRCNSLAENSGNQLVVEMVGGDLNSTIISGMSKEKFISKVINGEFVDIKIINKVLQSYGNYTQEIFRVRNLEYHFSPGVGLASADVWYEDNTNVSHDIDLLDDIDTENWVED